MASCHLKPKYPYAIHVDTLKVAFNMENAYEYAWVNGINFIQIHDTPYLCMFKSSDTLALFNVLNSKESIHIAIAADVNAFWVKSNVISYIDENDLTAVHQKIIDTNNFGQYINTEYQIPKIFNDSFFISAIYLSKITPLKKGSFIVPYRVRNDSPNLLDTFSYIYLQRVENNPNDGISDDFTVTKMVSTPKELMEHYEYLRFPIAVYDDREDKLYFAFQKFDSLYSYSFNSRQYHAVKMDGFDNENFSGKQRDLTYLRKYLKENDKIEKIMVDDQSNIFVFKNNKELSKISSEIIVFNSEMDQIAHLDVAKRLDPAISFIKNNKLYVYEASSKNKFFVFSLLANKL